MILTQEEIRKLEKIAIEAALKAGHYIREEVKKQHTVLNKEGADSLASQVFTEVDLKSQELIVSHLSPTLSEYDLALLTEESPDDASRFDKDYFWCIDPLDGTLAFIEQKKGYSVSIGLVSKAGMPVLGVIYDPYEDQIYHGSKNSEMAPKDNPSSSVLTLVTDRTFYSFPQKDQLVNELEQLAKKMNLKGVQYKNDGGAAMNAMWVLENSPAVYFKLPKSKAGGGSLWDFAASASIFQSAGAHVSDVHGGPLELNRKTSTFMNHKGALYASNPTLAKNMISLLKSYYDG